MTVVLLTLMALLVCTPAFAQSAAGEIWGLVTTTTGEVVEGASVTATNVDTGAERETRTDSQGRFGFAALLSGHYQVTAQRGGFAGRRQDDIFLMPAQRMQVELPLRRAPLPETIALNPYPPIMESGRTHGSGFIAQTEIEDLAVPGRRYLGLAQLLPAVTTDATTGGVSVMNMPSAANRLTIDGFDHTSSITGEPVGGDGPRRVPYQLSQSAVEAFRIETNGAPAETGGASASVLKVVTRSGANAFHGAAQDYFGDRTLNGQKALDEDAGLRKPAYSSNQFAATLGGPLQRDHNFFLVNYDRLALTDSPSALVASRNQNQDVVLARTDHEYFGQHLTLRYIDQQFDGAAFLPPSIVRDVPSLLRTRSRAASLASGLGFHVVNEARAQSSDDRDEASPLHWFSSRRMQFSDTLSIVGGTHSVKVGGELVKDRNTTRFGPSQSGGMQIFDTGAVRPDVTRYAGFVQDAWRATRSLTVDLGVRYDQHQFAGELVPTRRNDWAPRAGFAFSPGSRRIAVRGAYGLFYGSTPALIPALAQAFNASDVRVFPAAFAFVDPSFKTPRVHQAMLGWEVEKYRAGTFGVDYLFARGERLARPVDVNVGNPFPGMTRVVSFQSTGQSIYNGLTAHTRGVVLQALYFTMAYTFSRSDETPLLPVTVPFGDLEDRTSLSMQGDILNARAPGNNDRHQQAVASVMYNTSLIAATRHGLVHKLLKDWELGLTYVYQTGQPYTAFVSGDINGDYNAVNDVAPGTSWNQYRLPYQASFNPRVARSVKVGGSARLWLIWEAFNLTNRPNYTVVDNTLYTLSGSSLVPNPLFGHRTGQADARVMQFAARLGF